MKYPLNRFSLKAILKIYIEHMNSYRGKCVSESCTLLNDHLTSLVSMSMFSPSSFGSRALRPRCISYLVMLPGYCNSGVSHCTLQ